MRKLTLSFVAAVASLMAQAQETAPQDQPPEWFVQQSEMSGFGGWRVSAGGSFGFGLKTKMGFAVHRQAYARPTSPALGSPSDIAARLASGQRASFLDGAYIEPMGANENTQNWRFPESAVDRSTGVVTLESTQLSDRGIVGSGSEDDFTYGVSFELARTLYVHEDGYGVDLAVGLTWMRRNDCFKARSSGRYINDSTYVYTPSPGNMNSVVLTSPYITPVDGYYGAGTSSGMGAMFNWGDFGPNTVEQTSTSGSYNISASGDYEEWDILLMLKPWWEVTDFWRLTGTVGLGITRSEFESAVSATFGNGGSYSSHKTFDEWRCYGVAGLGTVLRYGRFDLSLDVLARFCQDDMKVKSEAISGKIEKPNLVLCAAVGFEF